MASEGKTCCTSHHILSKSGNDNEYESKEVNALTLIGPTNTVKSLVCSLLTEFLEYGKVLRRIVASTLQMRNFLFESLE